MKNPSQTIDEKDLILRQERVPCAGDTWVLSLHRRVLRMQPFPMNQALPPAPALLEQHLRSVERLWRVAGGRTSIPWVWLSPEIDPFQRSAAGWDQVALEMMDLLLQRGTGVLIRTRGGLPSTRHLARLAGENPGLVHVDVTFFSGDASTAAPWETGCGTIEERLGLISELTTAGAKVVARLGPLVPMINDDERSLKRLSSALLRQGVSEVVPEWITGSPGLHKRIERQVSRARSRMVRGWLHMEGAIRDRGPRTIPVRVQRPILRTLHETCRTSGVTLLTCACNSPDGLSVCTQGPAVGVRERQIGLFADIA